MASRRSFLKQSIIASPIPFVTTKLMSSQYLIKTLLKKLKLVLLALDLGTRFNTPD